MFLLADCAYVYLEGLILIAKAVFPRSGSVYLSHPSLTMIADSISVTFSSQEVRIHVREY